MTVNNKDMFVYDIAIFLPGDAKIDDGEESFSQKDINWNIQNTHTRAHTHSYIYVNIYIYIHIYIYICKLLATSPHNTTQKGKYLYYIFLWD